MLNRENGVTSVLREHGCRKIIQMKNAPWPLHPITKRYRSVNFSVDWSYSLLFTVQHWLVIPLSSIFLLAIFHSHDSWSSNMFNTCEYDVSHCSKRIVPNELQSAQTNKLQTNFQSSRYPGYTTLMNDLVTSTNNGLYLFNICEVTT